MSLRKNTLLLTGLILLGLVAAFYAVSQVVVLGGFKEEETRSAELDVQRIKQSLNAELMTMSGSATDWAIWDDMYQFMIDGNQKFRDSNLTDATFPNNQINIFLLVNKYGFLTYGEGYDLELGKKMPVPGSLLAQLTSDKLLYHPDDMTAISGILSPADNPMLVVSIPILDSQGQGPMHGTLIFGRYLDNAEIQRVSARTFYSLSLYQLDDPQMPADFQAAIASLPDEQATYVSPLSEQNVAGYTIFKDIYGKPALILRVVMPRTLYQHGQNIMLYVLFALVVVGVIFGIAFMFLLERRVLSRVARLSANANRVAVSGDLTLRMTDSGHDEVSSMAADINKMLQALEESRRNLVESERSHRQLMEQASDGIIVSYPGENFVEANSTICRMLGYTAEEMKTLGIEDVVAEHNMPWIFALHTNVNPGKVTLAEIEMIRKDGTSFAAEISAAKLSDGRTQGIVRDISERKIYERAQQENAAEQASLLRQLTNAQEAERRRLSMDIHDGPLQMLGVSIMALDRASRRNDRRESDLTRKELEYLRSTLTETVGEVRAVLADLSQDTLITYGLVVAIQTHIARFIDATSIHVEFANLLKRRLQGDIELLLYRLLQESLANVRKHSQADRVEVTLEEQDSNIIMCVSDNGIGFEVEVARHRHEEGQGIGLRSMSERVYGTGGTLSINSSPGAGATLEFTVPIPAKSTAFPSGILRDQATSALSSVS